MRVKFLYSPEVISMDNNILIKVERDPLFGMTRDAFVEKIRLMLTGRADEAYFFGSFTGDDFNKFSDIDIIIVKDTCKPFHERAIDYGDIPDLIPSTDILVYTRHELDRLLAEGTSGFWKSVKESMVQFI